MNKYVKEPCKNESRPAREGKFLISWAPAGAHGVAEQLNLPWQQHSKLGNSCLSSGAQFMLVDLLCRSHLFSAASWHPDSSHRDLLTPLPFRLYCVRVLPTESQNHRTTKSLLALGRYVRPQGEAPCTSKTFVCRRGYLRQSPITMYSEFCMLSVLTNLTFPAHLPI